MPRFHRQAANVLAGIAALSLTATPAAAAGMRAAGPAVALPSVVAATDLTQDGWGRYRRHRHRGGVDAGDVIAGVVVIGAIAAIASAASKDKRERYEERYPRRYPAREDVRYPGERRYDSGGIERAVDMCIDQVERGRNRVDNVENASRGVDGWRVSGQLESGAGFDCWIDNDGRIREIDTTGRYPGTATSDEGANGNSTWFASAEAAGEGQRQWSDEAYARARAQQDGDSAAPAPAFADERYREADTSANDELPAYPGGPVEGDEYPGGEWEEGSPYDSAGMSGANHGG